MSHYSEESRKSLTTRMWSAQDFQNNKHFPIYHCTLIHDYRLEKQGNETCKHFQGFQDF